MREYKFRAWSPYWKPAFLDGKAEPAMEYFELGELQSGYTPNADIGIYEVDVVVMQYTELKDRNGKEIYEGDILVYHGVDIREIPYHCFYEMRFGEYDNGESYDNNTSGCGWWLLRFKMTRDSGEIELENQVYDYRGLEGLEEMEVIGNIWGNPELLGE